MDRNPILDTDSYKLPMFKFYPDDVTNVYSYAESRGGRYPGTLFFGLQPWLRQLVERPVSRNDITEAVEFAAAHGEPFNRAGWMELWAAHGGYLPLEIKAIPEGTFVPTRNVLCTVENTDPEFPWLTTYVETAMLRQVWYATTVATRIFNMKKRIIEHFGRTSDSFDGVPFALLDFSSRGCASYGANEIGGAAYLAHFLGSDSVPAVRYTNHYYDSQMSGFSVPATEHSIMCAWGEDREIDAFKHMIDRCGGPGKIVSVVSDTYDVFRAAERWASLADYVRNSGTTLVFRPDSGEPEHVIPAVLKSLAAGFGTRTNSKGLEVIQGAKVLWGDGINEDTHMRPFHVAWDNRFAADSIITGSGGGLMQADIDRDTAKFAFKASAVSSDQGQTWEGIAKRPITDLGKKSKEGRLALVKTGGLFETWKVDNLPTGRACPPDLLRTVYKDGELFNGESIDMIRQRVDSHFQ